jgi:hypothetical protein
MPLISSTSDVFNRPKKRLDIKSCGPDAPMLASSLRIHSQATVANKPVTGEHEVSRKTIAQGRPDCLR